jgi:endo-1,4-beta-xylanase
MAILQSIDIFSIIAPPKSRDKLGERTQNLRTIVKHRNLRGYIVLPMSKIYVKKLTRRYVLWLGLAALTTIGIAKAKAEYKHRRILALDNPNRNFSVRGNIPLKARAAAKGLIYGAAIRNDYLSIDARLAKSIVQECRIVVPELAMKWFASDKPLRPNPDSFDFSEADKILNFAKTHRMLVRGHTLVWHESLPPWFKDTVTVDNAKLFLETHIKTVVNRYAGKIHSWDVVNEAINPFDGRDDGLRKTPWLELLGTDYIDYAFRLAHAADKDAMLVYNDYGMNYGTSNSEAKRTAVLKLLKTLKSLGTPIHALGIQGHLDGSETNFNPTKLREFLRDVASLGLKIMITELDVTDALLPSDLQVRDRIVAAALEDYLSVVLEEKAVTAVLTWGLSDKYTWLSEFEPRQDGIPVRPLLLDENMNRKLVWNALARSFDETFNRSILPSAPRTVTPQRNGHI